MKVVVVGCTHAGTAAVKTILNDNPGAQVEYMKEMTMYHSYHAVLRYT